MNPVINNYQQLSNLTAQMRVAATQGEWDQLADLEQQCSFYVERMKAQDLAPINEEVRLQKVALIHKILADDAAIRDQTLPWMAQLQQKIKGARSEQRVLQAYTAKY